MSQTDTLAAGLRQLGLALPAEAQRKLLDYLALLAKWNRVYNLTAVREPLAMITQHVLDSLAVLPHLDGVKRLADVGSGPGLPGIPLAIARPALQVVCIDSSQKKTAFQRQACAELALTNVTVVCGRVEAWQPSQAFDGVISRAFAELNEFVRLSAHLLAKNGKLYAMKGVYPHEEIAQLLRTVRVERVIPVDVPGLAAQRHLVVMSLEEQ